MGQRIGRQFGKRLWPGAVHLVVVGRTPCRYTGMRKVGNLVQQVLHLCGRLIMPGFLLDTAGFQRSYLRTEPLRFFFFSLLEQGANLPGKPVLFRQGLIHLRL